MIIDALTCLLVELPDRSVREYRLGGVNAISATAWAPRGAPSGLDYLGVAKGSGEGFRALGYMRGLIDERSAELLLIERAQDLETALDTDRLGVILNFQNSTHFEFRLDLVAEFYASSLRVCGLAYNLRNWAADGCFEEANAGLSRFGRRLVIEMNHVGLVVDGSHTGERSTLEAMDLAEAPFVFTHNGCKAVFDHPRNITDEQIRCCADTGGVVGIYSVPDFIGPSPVAPIEQLVRHIVHAVEVGGIEHVGIGTDFCSLLDAYRDDPNVTIRLPDQDAGSDDPFDLYEMHWSPVGDTVGGSITGMETPAELPSLRAALSVAGFSENESSAILGDNFLRVFRQTWK